MIFVKTLQKMLKKGLTQKNMSWADHYLREKIKN